MAKYKKDQLANIQIDYGIIYTNYGEDNERILGPTRGGGSFEATQNVRDIEFDGRQGKTKGMEVRDEIEAILRVSNLSIANQDLEISMPYLKRTGTDPNFTYSCDPDSLGAVKQAEYLKNITMFAKKTGGKYVKITLYNALNLAPFSLAAAPKAEGVISLEVSAHWEVEDRDEEFIDKLFEITTVDSIS